jgi:2-aminoadipate transaminase
MYNRSESMLERLTLDASSDTPLYRQLSEAIEREIQAGEMKPGDRLPATRLLANQLQLNRTTVSAAYALLEEQRLILSHVGRGSFVAAPTAKLDGLDWEDLLPRGVSGLPPSTHSPISFSTSRPSDDLFPMEQFRQAAREVIDSADARDILQLGSPLGYGPLRRYLSDEASREGVLRPGDDLIITNGCQQALDLLARLLFTKGESVIVEDPVYPGLLRVFEGAGANIIPVPVTEKGVDPAALQTLVSRHQPKAIVLTPSFQNPTGSSIPGPQRTRMVEIVREYGVVLIENDIYSELRYDGQPEQSLKRADRTGNVVLLRSYSKVSFPGLRVGWVMAPKPLVARLAELKQTSDLHSDQLSQAVLLRFAQSGGLARHIEQTRAAGALRLEAALRACRQYLPPGSKFTHPEGGINLWVQLPFPLNAGTLLPAVQSKGVSYLPGTYFSADHTHGDSLRLSFGGLSPSDVDEGIRIIGEVASAELAALAQNRFEPVTALV